MFTNNVYNMWHWTSDIEKQKFSFSGHKKVNVESFDCRNTIWSLFHQRVTLNYDLEKSHVVSVSIIKKWYGFGIKWYHFEIKCYNLGANMAPNQNHLPFGDI